MITHDVVVAGAGPAGALAAARLAATGLDVVLVDRKPVDGLGYPWADSIERGAFARTGLALPQGDEHAADISRMRLLTTDGATVATIAPYGYVLTHRRPFARRLLAMAEAAGATVRDGCPVLRPLIEDGVVQGVVTAKETIRARLTIDATGAARVLARHLDPGADSRADMIACYREQREAPGPGYGSLDVVAGPYGYTWITVDRAGELDIGTGAIASRGVTPQSLLAALAASRPDLQGAVRATGTGVVPLGQPPLSLVHPGLLVVGDAGFQVLPTSGTGVGSALVGAHLAAEAAVSALAQGRVDREALWGYNLAYFRERGARVAALDALRRELQALSAPEVAWLFERGLLPAATLEAAVHGRFAPPAPAELAKALGRGWQRLDVLLKLGIRLALAERLQAHFNAYPPTPGAWPIWARQARRLTSTLQ